MEMVLILGQDVACKEYNIEARVELYGIRFHVIIQCLGPGKEEISP